MDERLNKIKDLLIQGIFELNISNYVENVTDSEIQKAKKLISETNYEDTLKLLRLEYLYEKNIKLADYRECREILKEIERLSKKVKTGNL